MTLNNLCKKAGLTGTRELSEITGESMSTLIHRFNSKNTKSDKYKSVIAHIVGAAEIKRANKAKERFYEEALNTNEEMRLHHEKSEISYFLIEQAY